MLNHADHLKCIAAKSRPIHTILAIGGELKLWKIQKGTLTNMEMEMAELVAGKDVRNLSKFFAFKYDSTPISSSSSSSSHDTSIASRINIVSNIGRKNSESSDITKSSKADSGVSMSLIEKDILQNGYIPKASNTESDSTIFLLGNDIEQGNKGTGSGDLYKHKHNQSALRSDAPEFAFKSL